MVAALGTTETTLLPERSRLVKAPAAGEAPLPARHTTPAQPPVRPEPVQIQLSNEAKSMLDPTQQGHARAFAKALDQGLTGLGREAAKVLTSAGMTQAHAELAVAAIAQAVREVAGSPPFQGQILSVAASGQNVGPDASQYRASVIIEDAGLAWDPQKSEFIVTTRRVALSVALDSVTSVVPKAVPKAAEGGTRPSVLLDAVVPLTVTGAPPKPRA